MYKRQALELYDATVSLQNSMVRDNVASGVNKSTIHVYNEGGAGPTSTFDAQHNTIVNNSQYGIFYANTTGGTFDNNVVWGNTLLGFVTGGGWINSPAGAYVADPALAGKATFGFVSKYKKGMTVPEGNTEFQFHAAGLNFKSTSYQWLVVAGANAKFKGVGTINGAGNYGFMLTAWSAAGLIGPYVFETFKDQALYIAAILLVVGFFIALVYKPPRAKKA